MVIRFAGQTSFDEIISILSSPELYTPCKGDRFILEADASGIGIGCCLKAKTGHYEYIVGNCSDKFSNSELNWNIVEKEAFALVYNIRHFQHFLVGYPFTVRCDNRIVTYLQNKHKPRNKKLLHWALEADMIIHLLTFHPKNNIINDCFSRNTFVSTIHYIDNHFKIDEFVIAQQNDAENRGSFEIHSAK